MEEFDLTPLLAAIVAQVGGSVTVTKKEIIEVASSVKALVIDPSDDEESLVISLTDVADDLQ